MNSAESLPTLPPSPIAPTFSPITNNNNNNTPINSTVQAQDITPVNNSITYTSPAPTFNMINSAKFDYGIPANPAFDKFHTFFNPNHFGYFSFGPSLSCCCI